MKTRILSLTLALAFILALIPAVPATALTLTADNLPTESHYNGEHNGYDYSLWSKSKGTASMTLGKEDGAFSAEWKDCYSTLFRTGKCFFDKTHTEIGTITFDYSAEFTQSSNTWLSVYGWGNGDPTVVEYYIVDSWGEYRPQQHETPKGTVTIDGGTYEIYELIDAVIYGEVADFKQYWSVRTEKRDSGIISVTKHFEEWEKLGMKLGTLREAALTIETYDSSGSANITRNVMSINGEPLQPPPPPVFPYEIKEAVQPETATWFTVPMNQVAASEKMVIETSGELGWFQFETIIPDGWKGFQSGDSEVTVEDGKIMLDMRQLNISEIGFRAGNGDETKIKRIYLDGTTEPAPTPTPPPATATEATPYPNIGVTLDGTKIPVEVYGINGSTFLKLSDLAAAVGVHASWDGAVRLDTSKKPEATTPSAPSGNTGKVAATPYPNIKVTLDGKEIPVAVYGIAGSTFLSLKDVAAALGLKANWDGATSTAVLTR